MMRYNLNPPKLLIRLGEEIHPALVFDATGKIIERSHSGLSDSFIPYGVKQHTPVNSGEYLYDSFIDLNNIKEQLKEHGKGRSSLAKAIQKAYPDFEIPSCKEAWVPAGNGESISDQEVKEAISLIDSKKVSEEDKLTLINTLAESGVYPIPSLKSYNGRYHQVINQDIISSNFNVLEHGWMSQNKIYKKSLVQSS